MKCIQAKPNKIKKWEFFSSWEETILDCATAIGPTDGNEVKADISHRQKGR